VGQLLLLTMSLTPSQLVKMILIVAQRYAWCPILLFTVHVIAAAGLNLYGVFPAFDIPMHFMGGICIAYFFSGVYITANRLNLLGKPIALFHTLFVFTFASTTTIFWEFAEFLSDYFLHTQMQVSLYDTMKDMFLGMCGAVCLLLILQKSKAKKL
jgi:uncharacterized membrane protein YjdF